MGGQRGPVLSLNTTPRSRKYLGDPKDPHFVPSSPILSRQELTSKVEEELTRACKRVLAGVQHTDTVVPPYVSQITSYKQVHGGRDRQHRQEKAQPERQSVLSSSSTKKAPLPRRISDETATPSTISKQDTLDRITDTPLTSAGITPGETNKKFFDKDWRSGSAQSNRLSRCKKSPESNQVYSFLNHDPQRETRAGPIGAKSMTNLPTTSSSSSSSKQNDQRRQGALSPSAEFNKSLPDIPRFDSFSHFKATASPATKRSIHSRSGFFSRPAAVDRCQSAPLEQEKTSWKSKFHFSTLFSKKKRHEIPQKSS